MRSTMLRSEELRSSGGTKAHRKLSHQCHSAIIHGFTKGKVAARPFASSIKRTVYMPGSSAAMSH